MECALWHGMPSRMLFLMTLVAAASLTPPEEPLAGSLRAAIWNDLQLNSMIGNGNWLASLWYNAGQEDAKAPDLHILNISCDGSRKGYRCTFTLLRDGGVRTAFNEAAPDRLDCNAHFVRREDSDEWMVKHLPPRGSGHSRTDMRCEAVPSS